MNIYLYYKYFSPLGEKFRDGVAKAVHGLAYGLVECGANVTVLWETEPGNERSYKSKFGYEVKSFASDNLSPWHFKISPVFESYISNYLDTKSLVILNGIFHGGVYSMSRVLKKYQIPYVIAPHDPYSPAIFRKKACLKWLYWNFLEKRILKEAKAVQVLDARHGKFLEKLKVKTTVLATPNGFSPEDIRPESSLQWQQDGTGKVYFLGRIDAHNKGIDLLLKGFAEIADKEDVKLTIQGPDWGDKQSLQIQAAKLSLRNKVSFTEADYDKSPFCLMQNHDIFCIPSRFEGFSLAALEAMLAGRVLLVSEIAGIAPYVEASGCGVVVAPEVSAIKSGLTKLLQLRSDWKEMGLAGRRYAIEHLRWEKIASLALEQYKHL